ncbi:glycosyltransferase [Paenibacillus sp. SYP-B4298]|uniref:glycosyltransferase n=1 Tax=Paenibacillus sp. SYP-B4298 TaxID=2996034 RepID=UPI0022DD7762|nr:nucleotide disphospho-sugar-binding domain-containing protein [Paenibacillus sp. SYP-B4298]
MSQTKKGTIFVGMSSGFGPLPMIMPIVKKLEERGFEVICNIAEDSAIVLKRAGFTHYDEIPVLELPDNLSPKGPKWYDLDHYWGRWGYLDFNYVRASVLSYIGAIQKMKPDLIIAQFSPPTTIAARFLGIPLISMTQACFHPGCRGGRVGWWEEQPEEYRRTSLVVNEVLASFNLDPINKMEELNVGDITIIPSFQEFDPTEDDDAVYIGPLLWEGPKQHGAEFAFKSNDKNRIFVYTGNLHDSAGPSGLTILKNTVEALNHTEFEVIISTGVGQKLEEAPYTAPNITLTDWVSANDLIKECDLMIHHGGHGSIMLSLLNEVPSIAIPTFSEREYNARQLKDLGAGDYILPNELTPDKLVLQIRAILGNPEIKQAASYWANEVKNRNYGGEEQAAELISRKLAKFS